MKRAALLVLLPWIAACGDSGPATVDPPPPADAPPAEATASRPAASPARRSLPAGLVLETLAEGEGTDVRVGDRVTVHFAGRVAATGEEFASTARSGVPFTFRVGSGDVIPGWERGLVGVREGSRVRLEVPAALAYGEAGWGPVPAEADLVFEIRVVRVEG